MWCTSAGVGRSARRRLALGLVRGVSPGATAEHLSASDVQSAAVERCLGHLADERVAVVGRGVRESVTGPVGGAGWLSRHPGPSPPS